jgi:hypothetical protein
MNILKDGFALESAVQGMIRRGLVDLKVAPQEMDLHGGTDFLIPTDKGSYAAMGLTLRDDDVKVCRDGEKYAGFVLRKPQTMGKLAPLHIEVVITEGDELYWDEALKAALARAKKIASEWEFQAHTTRQGWLGYYRQVRLYANRLRVREEVKDFAIS